MQQLPQGACALCLGPLVPGYATVGKGTLWKYANHPTFQKVLPGRLRREAVQLNRGRELCFSCCGGSDLPTIKQAARAATAQPCCFPIEEWPRNRVFVETKTVSTGMPLATEFSRAAAGFTPRLLKRKLFGVAAQYSSEVPVVSTGTWTARLEDGTEVEKSTRYLHDRLVLEPGYQPRPGACAAHINIGCSNKTDQCRTACGALLSRPRCSGSGAAPSRR